MDIIQDQIELEDFYDKTNSMMLGDIIAMLIDKYGDHYNYHLGARFMEAQNDLVMELATTEGNMA
tara:strand:- start:55 stop:249 length:195 start_codon:yes stop_codon:yes gene_type:complete